MKKENKKIIYLGVWFQRNSLHLQEFRNFLNGQIGVSGLDKKEGDFFRNNLGLKEIKFLREDDYGLISARAKEMEVIMTEDGVTMLHLEIKEDFKKTINELEDFYSKKLSPTLTYLYSRGAPLPKDLSLIKEVYPLYLFGFNLDKKEIKEALSFVKDKPYLEEEKSGVEVYTGNEIVIVNLKNKKFLDEKVIKNLVRNLVLFREFEKQLSQYLNLHRNIWESINLIRESKTITIKNVPQIRYKILDHLKTLSFVRARLCQMKDILVSREQTLKKEEIKLLDDLDLENRFKILYSEQSYIINLWDMTTEYAQGTIGLLDSLINENTQKELGFLQTISFMGVATGFFGMNIAFPWNSEWPLLFKASYLVIGIILLFAVLTQVFLRTSLNQKKVKIK